MRPLVTPGLILSHTKWGDCDLLIEALTPEFGRIRAVARGARTLRSPMRSALEPLTHATLRGYEQPFHSLVHLTDATPQEWFPAFHQSLALIEAGTHFVSLLARLLPERDPNPVLYDLAIHGLRQMASAPDAPLLSLFLQLLSFDKAGYGLQLEVCALCAQPLAHLPLVLDLRTSLIHCQRCATRASSHRHVLGPGLVSLLRQLQRHPLHALDRLRAPASTQTSLRHILHALDQHLRPAPPIQLRPFSPFVPTTNSS